MKNVWIYKGADGDTIYSNPLKAYNESIRWESTKPSYSKVLTSIRIDGYYSFEDSDSGIVKVKVY